MTTDNISQVIQTPGNDPVMVSWGKKVSPVGTSHSVAGILDNEDRPDDGVPIQVNLLGILVSNNECPADADLNALLDNMMVSIRTANRALGDDQKGSLQLAVQKLVADVISVHSIVKTW
jgi:hypothetical protein